LYLQGNGLRGTGRILGLSNVTVLNWIQQFGNNIKEYALGNMPNEIRDIEIVEIDEMWHLTVKKTEIMAPDCDRQIGPGSHGLHRWRWQ
jgi:hypothetical protein